MQGKRKFWITILAVIVYGVILTNSSAEAFSVGAGMAMFLGTSMYGYHKEYQYKDKQP